MWIQDSSPNPPLQDYVGMFKPIFTCGHHRGNVRWVSDDFIRRHSLESPGWTASHGPPYLDPSILHSKEGEKITNVVWLSDFAYICVEEASS